MRKFAVLVHARELLVPDGQGELRRGGAYLWKVVRATDRSTAEAAAIEAALVDHRIQANLMADELPTFEPEEINPVEDDIHESGGPVFYFER